MLTENRKYHYEGELFLKKSRVLSGGTLPHNDIINWFFLNTGQHQYSFVYKILDPLKAEYGKAFRIKLSFTMNETVIEILRLNHVYQVLRGQELVGNVKLTRILN